jgi:acyl carrier protein
MSDLVTEIGAMVARITDSEPASMGAASRFDAIDGWSSLAALSLMVSLEQDMPIKLDLRRFMSVLTIGELAALVAEGLARVGSLSRPEAIKERFGAIQPGLCLASGMGHVPETCSATRRIRTISVAEGTTFPDM